MTAFVELNSDQRREAINTHQRYQAWREAALNARSYRGSMVWSKSKGHDYLLRSSYGKDGRRRQVSLGARSPATEHIKSEFDRARSEADERLKHLQPVMARQAAINRALGLGRVPLIGARIIRALDTANLLGAGIRILGTNAIYAYEAAAGVRIDSGLTTTEDIDLLFDSRARVSFVATHDIEEISLLRLLQRVDKTFQRMRQSFRAVNADGYLVDLIKPMRRPPWIVEPSSIGDDPTDLTAVEIAGLDWLESVPTFEAVAIDERGEPLRMATADPRVFVAHKLWLSQQPDREAIKRRRDGEQAAAIALLLETHLPHLAFERADLRMLPKRVFDDAERLFSASGPRP